MRLEHVLACFANAVVAVDVEVAAAYFDPAVVDSADSHSFVSDAFGAVLLEAGYEDFVPPSEAFVAVSSTVLAALVTKVVVAVAAELVVAAEFVAVAAELVVAVAELVAETAAAFVVAAYLAS